MSGYEDTRDEAVAFEETVAQPRPGVQALMGAWQCSYSSALEGPDAARVLGDHLNRPIRALPRCDVDCSNARMGELYESLLLKALLQDAPLAEAMLAVHEKVFAGLRARNPVRYEALRREWRSAPSAFPVNQKGLGVRVQANRVTLSADWLKHLALSDLLGGELAEWRDYFFNSVLHRVRGYRTNQKGRSGVESQVGITNFDYAPLQVPIEGAEAWMHPGRSKCLTDVRQSTLQRTMDYRDVPSACGMSGSTNFWTWTALASGADLSAGEARLLLLSAYVTLGSDGGHSLQEVLSSAALNATVFREAATYAADSALARLVGRSGFAASLEEVTREMNPVGVSWRGPLSTRMVPDDREAVGRRMFEKGYPAHKDKRVESWEAKAMRRELERFFLQGRRFEPFAHYTGFLGAIPGVARLVPEVLAQLRAYKATFC